MRNNDNSFLNKGENEYSEELNIDYLNGLLKQVVAKH